MVESGGGVSLAVLLGKLGGVWLLNSLELVRRTEVTKFLKSSEDGNKVFITQRCSNRSSRFLEGAVGEALS